MTQPPYPGDPGQSYPPQPGWPGQAAQPQQPQQPGQSQWAQQPTQAPQGWGQQPADQTPQQGQWGQQPQQPTAQWGATQYGQQAAPQYGAPAPAGGGAVGGFNLASAWPLLATAVAALVAIILIWAAPWVTGSIHPTNGPGTSGSSKPFTSGTQYGATWAVVFLIAAILAVLVSVAATFVKLPALRIAVPAAALLTAVFAGVELLYLNSKMGDARSALQAALEGAGGGTGSIRPGWGAWAALALAVIAFGVSVFGFVRSRAGGGVPGAPAYGTGYPTAAPGYGAQQQTAWGQPQQAQQPPQQWGQPGESGTGAQPQWGQPQPTQQPQWGQPGQQQWGQQPPQQ